MKPPLRGRARGIAHRHRPLLYAVLLVTREILSSGSPLPVDRGETAHRTVLDALRESADSTSQLLSRELATLRSWRNRAEYGEDLPGLDELAERTARSCAKALTQAQALERRLQRR